MIQKPTNVEDQIDDLLAECYADPLRYVMSVFPWDTDNTIQRVRLAPKYQKRFRQEFGPDVWACEFLDQLGADIRARKFDGTKAVMPIQYAVASGHGIGKSVMVAWLVKFITDTRPFCRGTVTATTADQLRAKTWAEVGKWHKFSLTAHRFDYKTGRGSMLLAHKEHPERWYCQAQTCREENSEAFAGQHAADSTSFYIFDEATGVPPQIYQVRSGGLTDGEPMTFDFGNPTRSSGEFYEECEGLQRRLKRVWHIDSRDVQITNKEYFAELAALYGEDSDYFRVRCKGQFPATGSLQFIGTGDVEAAMTRPLIGSKWAPLVIGVDVARFGDDDSVIKARLGDDARSWPAKRFKGLDTVQLVGQVITTINEFRALGLEVAGLFVDGGGVGGGVVDQLRHLGYKPIEVQFGGSPTDPNTYRYKADEIWGKLKDHIRTRLCLPERTTAEGLDTRTQLTSREYGLTQKGQISLESKKDMKERGIGSPDLGDALALTYAQDVAPIVGAMHAPAAVFAQHEYDPIAVKW